MKFEVKSEILGFEKITEVELNEVDELFSTLRSSNEKDSISFTLINPRKIREYSFDISSATEALLDIKNEEDLLVYNIVVIQNPIDESVINFRAPLIFNKKNMTVSQEVLGIKEYPSYGYDESLKTFINK